CATFGGKFSENAKFAPANTSGRWQITLTSAERLNDPILRSGFRLRARTPAIRLNKLILRSHSGFRLRAQTPAIRLNNLILRSRSGFRLRARTPAIRLNNLILRSRSGFRLRARTPAIRLNLRASGG